MALKASSELRMDYSKLRKRFSVGVGLIGVVLCIIPYYVSILPPINDFSQHVLISRIILKFNDPLLRYSDYFTIDWRIAPASLFYVMLMWLQSMIGPFWDARVYLSIWVTLTWLAVWYLAKVRGQPNPWLAAIVVLPLSFNWYVYGGTLPFLMTIPLFAMSVSVWYTDYRPLIKIALLWILFFLLFGFHIVGVATTAFVIMVGAIVQITMDRKNWRQLIWASLSVIPAALLTCSYLLGKDAPSANIHYGNLVSQLIDVVKFTCGSLDDVTAALLLLWLGLLGLVIIFRWRDLIGIKPIFISAISLVILAILMPVSLGALWPAGPRLLPFAIILFIASLQWSALPKYLVMIASILLLIGMSVFTIRHAIELDHGYRDYLSAVKIVEPGKRILPILINPHEGSRWTAPYWFLISAYTVLQGGSNPYVFAEPHIRTGASPLKYRHKIGNEAFAYLYERKKANADYRGVSDYYDYVLLWGKAPHIEAVIGEEMGKIHVRGKATLFARHELIEKNIR